MSHKKKAIVVELLQKANSEDGSVALDAIQKLSQMHLPSELIIDVRCVDTLRAIYGRRRSDEVGNSARRLSAQWQNDIAYKEQLFNSVTSKTSLQEAAVYNSSASFHPRDISGKYNTTAHSYKTGHSYKSADPTRHDKYSASHSYKSGHSFGEQAISVKHAKYNAPHAYKSGHSSVEQVDPTKPFSLCANRAEKPKKLVNKPCQNLTDDAKQLERLNELSNGKRQSSLHSDIPYPNKISPIPHMSTPSKSHDAKYPRLEASATDKVPPDLFRKTAREPGPPETVPSDTKHSLAQSHKLPSNSKPKSNTSYSASHYFRKNLDRSSLPREGLSHAPLGTAQGADALEEELLHFSRDCASANRIANGHSHTKTSHPHSKEVSYSKKPSHNDGKKPFCESECSSKPLNCHRKVPNLERDPAKYLKGSSPKRNLSVPQHCSPRRRGLPSSSLGSAANSRPDSSSSNLGEYSSEDRPDESVNLMIDTTDSSGDTNSDQNLQTRSPYSIELKEGMFAARKVGSDTLRVREIRGTGDLRDGGFSWGWTMEKRSPLTYSSAKYSSSLKEKNPLSSSKEKNPLSSSKEKNPLSSSKEKNPLSSSKEKNPLSSSKEKNPLSSSKEKTLLSSLQCKRKLDHDPAFSAKKSTPSKVPDKSVASDSFLINYESTTTSFPNTADKLKHLHSPVAKKKSPNYVHCLDGNGPLQKVDCDVKSSKVIDDSTMGFISSKKDRRTIYSGKKTAHEIQSLKVICHEYLKKHILNMRVSDRVPFCELLPVLELCSPSKLYKIEEQNRHLTKHTNSLWEKFCKTEFRDQQPTEGQLWKYVYWKAWNKREKKLKSLTASISNGMAKAQPERQAKFMSVDARDPEKRPKKIKVEESPSKPEVNGRASVPPPVNKSSSSESSSPQLVHKISKPSKQTKKAMAPLMSKTKKMLNFVNRRR